MPPAQEIESIEEPYLKVTILTPDRRTRARSWTCARRGGARWRSWSTSRPSASSCIYRIPLAEVVIDFFDQLKSRTQGYASLDYEPAGYDAVQPGARSTSCSTASPVDAFSHHRPPRQGRRLRPAHDREAEELIPRQLFDVPIQAAIGGRIIARETVKAKRKDVLAKCYGGDITRKRKLLEKQKEGKKRMKNIGRVEVPQEAFIAALRLED